MYMYIVLSACTFQADLGLQTGVSAILIQGRGDNHNQYVKTFLLAVSDDGSSFEFITADGSTSSDEGVAFEFQGNTDKETVVEVTLPRMVLTRHVRLLPRSYFNHISLRWDILTCRPAGWLINLTLAAPRTVLKDCFRNYQLLV